MTLKEGRKLVIEHLVGNTVGRVSNRLGIHPVLMPRWNGRMAAGGVSTEAAADEVAPTAGPLAD
ncbi:MAG: hypothetical protein IH876_02260 [Gemmatimonadetes bacterium]|nr:hypothetical protein [Gemmatimonadota bacterium]